MQIQDIPRLLTPQQAAEYLNTSPGTLANWRCTKRVELPFIRLGDKKILYDQSDLIDFLESRKVRPNAL